MILTWIWLFLIGISITAAVINGNGSQLSAAAMEGAGSGVTLAISMAGSICLWTGIGRLMSGVGISGGLARILRPVLTRLFPDTKKDLSLAKDLSANICANLLGLGNAATPMGIQAARRMVSPKDPAVATDQMCRLIVLNTASIQLIPASVAAVRLTAGCRSPFDILPAVWLTSLCSASLGLLCAWIMGKLWKHD